MKYVSLHHHSTYSYMDGFASPAAHVARAAELGMTALALTEHGNVSSHVQLEKAATKVGIRPIFGIEAYTEIVPKSRRKFHLSILAADAIGYANLMRVVTKSWQNFYQWPTVSGAILAEHAEGLIVLSGCADSLLACRLLGGKTIDPAEASYDAALRQAAAFRDLLGDRFYLETQMFPELERTGHINRAYADLSRELKIPLVATADAHYPMPDDNEMQVILHAAGRGAGSVAAQEATWEYNIRLTFPTSDDLVIERLCGTGLSKRNAQSALASTAEIAERCAVSLPRAERFRFPVPDAKETIWNWLREGWSYRVRRGNRQLVERKAEYVARLHHEMELIEAKDFLDYFLLCSDAIRHAKDTGIPVGPGRGSSAGSLVCYLLRITEIDPVPLPLMRFDRFIDLTREDLPDIDSDFDDDRRGEVRADLIEKYGHDRVGNIANYSRYKGKTAINDVARVFNIPYGPTEEAKGMIVERSGGDSRDDFALQDTVDMFPQVKKIFDDWPDLYKAIRLEGNYRGMSTHAAGLVVSDRPIADVCAMYEKDGRATVSVDKKDAEYLGLMKLDFLSLTTMGMIRIALGLAGLTLEDLYAIPIDDRATLEAFRRNDVVGIFQFEGRATRMVNRLVKPDDFYELVHVNGLSRPGPLFSGTSNDFIDAKNGKIEVPSFHPIIDRITVHTRGAILYQEQILSALAEFGGLSIPKVHQIRRIISQKLGEAQFNNSAEDFASRAVEMHGVTRDLAMTVWGRVVSSASYAFVYAHALCYALIGWWSMWLKTHYPAPFYTAQLTKSDPDNWPRLIRDAEKHGIVVRGVKPGLSENGWRMHEDCLCGKSLTWPCAEGKEPKHGKRLSILAGWIQLKGVGEVTATRIAEYVGDRQSVSVDDLLNVRGIGPATLEKFRAQIETSDPFGLQKTKKAIDAVRGAIPGDIPVRRPTHNSEQAYVAKAGSIVVWLGMVKKKEFKDYIEDQRARFGLTVEEITANMKDPDKTISCVLHCYDDLDEEVYVRVPRFYYPKYAQALEEIRVGHDVIHVIGKKSLASGVFGMALFVQDLTVIDPEED